MPKIKDKTSRPVFVYAHMSLPHDPYVFDEYGNSVSFNRENIDTATEREFYLLVNRLNLRKLLNVLTQLG